MCTQMIKFFSSFFSACIIFQVWFGFQFYNTLSTLVKIFILTPLTVMNASNDFPLLALLAYCFVPYKYKVEIEKS